MSDSKEKAPAEVGSQVAILMGTYNGEAYLADQLASIERQSHANWMLHVSDDSSAAATKQLLETWQRRWGVEKLCIHRGRQQGFAANFMSLVRNPTIKADYYAFADQDDIWHVDKLQRALLALAKLPSNEPQLYTARTRLIDEHGTPTGESPLYSKPPAFANALVQNIASGNTMLFNQAARDYLIGSPHGEDTGLHDWWSYLLISGCGGNIVHDAKPCLDYRQHANNQIGMKRGLKSLAGRVTHLWQGSHRHQVDRNLEALADHQAWLTPAHQAMFRRFLAGRKGNAFKRLDGIRTSGVYRQTWQGNIALKLAALLNKG